MKSCARMQISGGELQLGYEASKTLNEGLISEGTLVQSQLTAACEENELMRDCNPRKDAGQSVAD